jgi:hypothetical protein
VLQKIGAEAMDDQTLERLMIDDALGALPPDVSELLAAHTSSSPLATEQKKRWRQTAELAGRASESHEQAVATLLPPLSLRSHPRRARIGLAIAAAWLIGIGIGLLMPHGSATNPGPSPAVIAKLTPSSSSSAPPAGVTDFWSSQRLISMATAGDRNRPRTASAKWHWTSPVRAPEVGGYQ